MLRQYVVELSGICLRERTSLRKKAAVTLAECTCMTGATARKAGAMVMGERPGEKAAAARAM